MKPAKGKIPSQLRGHQFGAGGKKMTPKPSTKPMKSTRRGK
jgi:hypothetical protein